MHAAYDGAITSADLSVRINSAKAKSEGRLEVQVHVYRQGSIEEADLNLEDIMETARTFPVSVAGDNAFPFAVTIQDYKALKNPVDDFNFYEIQNQLDVLANEVKVRFEFLELRDDFSYILQHIDDFEDPDGSPLDPIRINATRSEIIDVINAMQKEIVACSKDADECEFTKFDPGEYPKPNLKEQAAPPPKAVPAPNVIGMKLPDLSELCEHLGISWDDFWDRLEGPDDKLAIGEVGRYQRILQGGYEDQNGVYQTPHTQEQMVVVGQSPVPGTPLAPGSAIRVGIELAPGVI